MPENLSQRDSRWSNIKLGFSDFTLGTHGCTCTSLAMLLGLTPDVVNEKLKSVQGFQGALIIWSKLQEAFPQIKSATRVWSYDNDVVAANLPCLVEVDGARIGATKHWVLYIGGGQMIDPWTGVTKATSYYPAIGFTKIELNPNYNPADEKLYTEAQMTVMREQRDRNHNLYLEAKADYESQKTITEETKKELNQFIETTASKLGTIADKAQVVGAIDRLIQIEDQLNQANKKIQDQEKKFELERSELKNEVSKLQSEIEAQENKYQDLISQLQAENLKLKARLDTLVEKIDNSSVITIKAENWLLQLLTAIKKLLRIK